MRVSSETDNLVLQLGVCRIRFTNIQVFFYLSLVHEDFDDVFILQTY
jgi:hypothetical protein